METSEKSAEKQARINFRDLYPTLTDEQLKEAEENLRRYLEIALEIHNEQCAHPDTSVDTASPSPTIKERSNISLKN